MCLFQVCLLWILLALTIEQLSVYGKVQVVLETVEANCDHDVVEYFYKVPNQEILYTFRVTKSAPSFSISVIMRAVKSQRIMYRLKNIDGCQFLKNASMNKILAHSYRTLIGNFSSFECPIPPKVYFLRNLTGALLMPSMHPIGHYQLSVRMKMPQATSSFVMEVLWKYKIMRTK